MMGNFARLHRFKPVLTIMNKDVFNNSTESLGDRVKKLIICAWRAMQPVEREGNSYSLSTKLEAITSAENNSKEALARKFRVDARRIQEWCKTKAIHCLIHSLKGGKRDPKRMN